MFPRNAAIIRFMPSLKSCPFEGCTHKIRTVHRFCRAHTDHSHSRPPITTWERMCQSCGVSFHTTNPRGSRCAQCKIATCVICKKDFDRQSNYTRQTCSVPCGRRLAQQSDKRTRTALTCHHCGKSFYSPNGHLGTKFCSKACRYAASRKPDTDKKRNSYQYRQWRDAVYQRDNFRCQVCGSEGAIQAHHLEPWHTMPALRYEVSNGITLCQTCHENIHGAHIPRVTKRFAPVCSECGQATKGKGQRCRSCGVRLSAKAMAAREALLRDASGRYTS